MAKTNRSNGICAPAVTTRGLREPDMDIIADCIARTLTHVGSADVYDGVRRILKIEIYIDGLRERGASIPAPVSEVRRIAVAA